MRPVARFGVHGSVLGVIATSNGATVSLQRHARQPDAAGHDGADGQ